jgi:dipeptidyl-peptidase-3
VHAEYLAWRDVVLAQKISNWVFVQANTFFQGDEVVLKEYEPTAVDVVQSWFERHV